MRKYLRLQKRIHGNLPRSKRISGIRRNRAALTTEIIAGQQSGAIQFRPHSIMNFKLTPIKRGEKISLVPKMKIWTPEMVAAKGVRYRSKQKVKFTREQRISTAKALAVKKKTQP